LLHTGYLTIQEKYKNDQGQVMRRLKVPNKEVMSVYEDIVKNWFEKAVQGKYYQFIDSLATSNVKKFCGFLEEYILTSSSYFDLNENTPESVFHVLMLGIFVGFRSVYKITSNREGGYGRYDIIMEPRKSGKRGIILEFKTCADETELEKKAKEALAQIHKQKYAFALEPGEILCIGIAFCGKKLSYEQSIIVRKAHFE
jgi:hypothetical protein